MEELISILKEEFNKIDKRIKIKLENNIKLEKWEEEYLIKMKRIIERKNKKNEVYNTRNDKRRYKRIRK